MAQVVGYFQNNDTINYKDGPFVLVDIGGEVRIEVEVKEHRCPTIPDRSILAFLEQRGIIGKTKDVEKAGKACNELNQMVKEGRIILYNGWWVKA